MFLRNNHAWTPHLASVEEPTPESETPVFGKEKT
jgi:hypothetical protein